MHLARHLVGAAAVLLLAHAPLAAAYIDPGTGSAAFYVVTGLIVSAYYGARSLYYRAIYFFFFCFRRREQKFGIAIHCEDPRYEITFLPVIRAMAARGLDVTLFTMYPRDDSFAPLPRGTVHHAIPPGMVGYAYLNSLEAQVLVTTTPQLDVMTFRRSPRVGHYIMLQHALGECRYVRPYAYDYFDSVLCCGPIVKTNIRRMEHIRESRPKQLLETGLPHYEAFIDQARRTPQPSEESPVVLVAPSWGPLSMFEAFGPDFVAEIAKRFRVIVRPHPQMRLSQPDLYARIVGLQGVEVSTERTPAEAMARASILLSDISGISHEFAFIHERPVLVIDRALAMGGLEGEILGGDSELKIRCSEFIVPVPPTEMPQITDRLARALRDHSAERIALRRAELVYNFGHASEIAADQIEQIYRDQLAVRATRPAAIPLRALKMLGLRS